MLIIPAVFYINWKKGRNTLYYLFSRYGSIKVNDEERLTGPGTNFDVHQDEAEEDEGLWSRRY